MKPSWAEHSPYPRVTNCRERAQVPLQAVRLVAGQPLRGSFTNQCSSLLPLGGILPPKPWARPYFAAREEMALQLPRLAVHYEVMWLKRLWAPARLSLALFASPARGRASAAPVCVC